MKRILLYTTLGCHLCEQALSLLEALPEQASFELELVDIADDDGLVERYGIRIPVIQRVDNGQELGWPFDLQQLGAFLS